MKDKSKDQETSNNNKKPFIITILVAILITIILLLADTFNIPTKLGFNVNVINANVWSVFLENIVVITIFVITFTLFDKRTLEKDSLGKFAGAVTLLDTYKQLRAFFPLLEAIIDSNNKDEESQSENEFYNINEKQSDYITNTPFTNDGRIFELLQNGYIQKEQYQNYDEIMQKYRIVVFFATELKSDNNSVGKFFNDLKTQLESEIKAIETYRESL